MGGGWEAERRLLTDATEGIQASSRFWSSSGPTAAPPGLSHEVLPLSTFLQALSSLKVAGLCSVIRNPGAPAVVTYTEVCVGRCLR